MFNGIRASEPRELNKGRGSKFCICSRVRQETPEDGQRRHQLKLCEYKNKDEDNIPKTLNVKLIYSYEGRPKSSKPHPDSKCDGKLTKIPKTGLYFRTYENGAGWHLIPYGISPRSEFFSQAYKNWHITWGINLEPDWPPLAKGFQISHYHTPTRPLNFFPLDNRRIRAYRS